MLDAATDALAPCVALTAGRCSDVGGAAAEVMQGKNGVEASGAAYSKLGTYVQDTEARRKKRRSEAMSSRVPFYSGASEVGVNAETSFVTMIRIAHIIKSLSVLILNSNTS